jgi:hypothetical protein
MPSSHLVWMLLLSCWIKCRTLRLVNSGHLPDKVFIVGVRWVLTVSLMYYSVIIKSLCAYTRCWKWCPRASIQAWTHLVLFSNSTNCITIRYRVFLGIFQQIAPALNRCIYCLLNRCIQQENYISQLKESQWVKSELNNYALYRYCTSTTV